jgi:ubiquitin-protein ligase
MNTNPRQRRLAADYAAVRRDLAGHKYIRYEPIGALPPEIYRVTYNLQGLRLDGDQPILIGSHVCEIYLTLGYPREEPRIVPLTPVFHPNVNQSHYCIGDYWSAGQTLVDIILKVGDMLQYKIHNVKAALNADAARWVEDNKAVLPIGHVDLGRVPDDPEGLAVRVTKKTHAGSDQAHAKPQPPRASGSGRIEVDL